MYRKLWIFCWKSIEFIELSLNMDEFNLSICYLFVNEVISDLQTPFTKSSDIGLLDIITFGSLRIFCSLGINFEYHPLPLNNILKILGVCYRADSFSELASCISALIIADILYVEMLGRYFPQ